jgi:hypothetical protein
MWQQDLLYLIMYVDGSERPTDRLARYPHLRQDGLLRPVQK